MNQIIVKDNLTLVDIAKNPAGFPAEVKAAALDTMKELRAFMRECEQNISANVIREMQDDNATKILFINVKGEEKTLTLKSAPKKLNSGIKNYEEYVTKAGFHPSQLGTYEYVPKKWSECKELRKQGGNIQIVIDDLYIEGQPSLEIK